MSELVRRLIRSLRGPVMPCPGVEHDLVSLNPPTPQSADGPMRDADAPEPVPWGGWMPAIVCHDIHFLDHDGRLFVLDIRVTSQLQGEERHGPIPVRADLGRRIADLIRADIAATTGLTC